MAIAEPSSVPPLTREKLHTEHPDGTRHQAKLDIAMSLIGNGLSPDDVGTLLRSKFPAATDREIDGVLRWATEHDPQPSGRADNYHEGPKRKPENFMRGKFRPEAPQKPSGPLPATETLRRLRDWLGDILVSEDELIYASPVKPSTDLATDATVLFHSLYGKGDLINIVVEYTIATTAEGRIKANPKGGGKILAVKDWLSWFATKGVPSMKAGAWVRPNPVAAQGGSGKVGAVMDKDIAAPRFVLLESDSLPLQYQLTAMAVFKLPIAAILTSGGASYHAWVKVDCDNLAQFDTVAERILKAVEPFGFDTANRNPSRLSRLVGVRRGIGGSEDPRQRLIYLNPSSSWKSIL